MKIKEVEVKEVKEQLLKFINDLEKEGKEITIEKSEIRKYETIEEIVVQNEYRIRTKERHRKLRKINMQELIEIARSEGWEIRINVDKPGMKAIEIVRHKTWLEIGNFCTSPIEEIILEKYGYELEL